MKEFFKKFSGVRPTKKGWVLIAAVVVLILLILNACFKDDTDKYFNRVLTYSGINGCGYLDPSTCVNYSRIKRDFCDESVSSAGIDVTDCVVCKMTEGSNGALSNDDKIKIEVTIDRDKLAKKLSHKGKLRLKKQKTVKYTVNGLTEGTSVNIFDAIERVVFDSTMPAGPGNPYVEYKKNYEQSCGGSAFITVEGKAPRQKVKFSSGEGLSFYLDPDFEFKFSKTQKGDVEVSVQKDAYDHMNTNVVLSPVSKTITPETVSFCTEYNFSRAALNELHKRVCDRLYYYENPVEAAVVVKQDENGKVTGSRLAFFIDDYYDEYVVYYYDDFKLYSTGVVYGFSTLKPRTDGDYDVYESIEDYTESIGYTSFEKITLNTD